MSTAPRPLRVVAVSPDRALLHEISWLLENVGYDVQTTCDFASNALWRRYSRADFVIVDGRDIAEPTAETLALDAEGPVYRIFLYDATRRADFELWYAAGAHDALHLPLSRGELLARLRAGARFLEFERRLEQTSSRSAVPGMLTRRGLLRRLAQLNEKPSNELMPTTLVAASIDSYTGIARKCGDLAAHKLIQAVARAIHRAAGDGTTAAYLGGGRFVMLLVGRSIASAKNVAESLAKEYASRESHASAEARPTLTTAVVPMRSDKPEAYLARALETLRLAETSGGDCMSIEGEYSQEFAAWREEMSAGNPFGTVIAQDIMEPFPALLDDRAPNSVRRELTEALERSGMPVRPRVDREGRLVGVAAAHGQTEVPDTIAPDASFSEIYEAFSSRGCSTLVVSADNRPLGYLTCEGFLSMIDAIDSESYALTDRSVDDLAYLAVPSVTEAHVEPVDP